MRDAELRALVRRAEAEPGEAVAAARALARAGKYDEAARLTWLARARGEKGEELDAVEKSLEPASLDDFSMRELASGLTGPRCPTWSADGKTLFVVDDERTILALDAISGADRKVVEMEGDVLALAAEPSGRWLAVAWMFATPRRPTTVVGLLELATAKVGEPVTIGRDRWPTLALTGVPGRLLVNRARGPIRWFRVEARGWMDPSPRKVTSITQGAAPGLQALSRTLRFGALGELAEKVTVVDGGEAQREFVTGAPVRGTGWSPSGRRLAVALQSGRVLVIEAEPEPRASGARLGGTAWTELRRGSRFWRVRRVGATVELRYGGVYERGVFRSVRHPDDDTAARDLERRIIIKESEGYRRVP
jgi:hypothetical protein